MPGARTVAAVALYVLVALTVLSSIPDSLGDIKISTQHSPLLSRLVTILLYILLVSTSITDSMFRNSFHYSDMMKPASIALSVAFWLIFCNLYQHTDFVPMRL